MEIHGVPRTSSRSSPLAFMGRAIHRIEPEISEHEREEERLSGDFQRALVHHDKEAVMQGAPDAIGKIPHILQGKPYKSALTFHINGTMHAITNHKCEVRLGTYQIRVKIDQHAPYNLINAELPLQDEFLLQHIPADARGAELHYYKNIPLRLLEPDDMPLMPSLFITDSSKFVNKQYRAILGLPWMCDAVRHNSEAAVQGGLLHDTTQQQARIGRKTKGKARMRTKRTIPSRRAMGRTPKTA